MPQTPSATAHPILTDDGRLRHFPSLDGVRGIAVAMVLGIHMLYGRYPGGLLGVDVFFCLSGFLITALLLVEWDATGTISFRRFYTRRARRLLPALFALIVGCGVLNLLFPELRGSLPYSVTALAAVFYVSNWVPISSIVLLSHTWSLAVEEQFYLLWPAFLAWLLRRRLSTAGVVRWVVAVLLVCFAFGVVSRIATDWRLIHNTVPRLAELMVGCLLALAAIRRTPFTARLLDVWGHPALASVALLGLLLAGRLISVDDERLFYGGFLLAAAATSAVIAHCLHRTSPLTTALAWKPLTLLGLISYGVYLYHWPITQTLTPERIGLGTLGTLAVQLALTLLVSIVSYRYLEVPIRRRVGRPRATVEPIHA